MVQPVQKSAKSQAQRSKVKSDGSSKVPGQSQTTFYSVASAEIAAKAGRFQNEAPVYPALALERGQEGLVLLRVKVDRQGKPVQVEVKKSSGYGLLDREAEKAVRKWQFEPGHFGGRPVESEINIPIRFDLEKNSAH